MRTRIYARALAALVLGIAALCPATVALGGDDQVHVAGD